MKPRIDIVVIGVNVEQTIDACLTSIRASLYPSRLIKVFYVDGGSMDASRQRASAHDGVELIDLNMEHPTPGAGRNAGFRASRAPFILFLDGDTILHPLWLPRASRRFMQSDGRLAAITGLRREIEPAANAYHRIAEVEWNYPIGECEYFGGDVMIRREYMTATGGYDEKLIAGEDPDLSRRIRALGGVILRLPRVITYHDINMKTPRSYCKRSIRSGHAYLEIAARYFRGPNPMWLRQCLRVPTHTVGPLLVGTGLAASANPWLAAAVGLLWFIRPLRAACRMVLRSPFARREIARNLPVCFLHLHAAPWLQLLGMLRYVYGRLNGNPMRNKGITKPMLEENNVHGNFDLKSSR